MSNTKAAPISADRLERIVRAMRVAEKKLMTERYEVRRSTREPYEDFQHRVRTAMALAALKVAGVTQ